MSLYDSLLKKYGTNEPILTSEISYMNYSVPWIKSQLALLCDEQKLIRFEKGVYYIPTDTFFGKSILNPKKVIEKKYLKENNNIIGYYSGLTLQNQMKLTTQMSNVIEIFTNNESTRVRETTVGNQRVILRKARTAITNENVKVLTFLEMMNDIVPRLLDDNKKKRIVEYINTNKITRKDILSYSAVFPDKVMRNLIESEVIFNVAY